MADPVPVASSAPLRNHLTVGIYNGQRQEMEPAFRLITVLRGGTDALRKAGEEFTPPTAREKKEPGLYSERMKASVLHDVFDQAVKDIVSRPFEKPPVIAGDLSGSMLERIYMDADREGTPLSVFLAQHFEDAVAYGMGLFLVDNVDARDENGAPLKRNIAEDFDARPYFVRILPENVVGFKAEKRMGRDVCIELRVREWAYKPTADYTEQLVERIRIYTGTTVELWERNYGATTLAASRALLSGRSDTSGFALIDPPRPTGFPDDVIPLVVTYTDKCGFLHAKPPLLQLAHLNLNHWNKSSIHDNALRYCMSPLLFGTGLSKKETEQRPKTGEGAVLLSESKDADLRFVEITGTTFAESRSRIEQLEWQMRARASEPLESGSATATGEMRAEIKGQSQAQHWIEKLEWSAYKAYELAAAWLQEELPEDFNVTVHRASSIMIASNPERTRALQEDKKNGWITLETYLRERQRTGHFADEFDPVAEAAAVAEEKASSDAARMEAMVAQIESERADAAAGDQEDDAMPKNDKPKPSDGKAAA